MNSMLLAVALLLALGVITGTTASEGDHSWDYGRRGPDVWRHDYKECRGLRQSPINIEPGNAQYSAALKPFTFVNYERAFRWNVSHNGHTVVLHKIDGSDVFIRGSDLEDEFELLQFHFHWGYNDYQGSEHLISKEKYPLEMHLVHQSSSKQLTVLGIIFQLSPVDNPKLNILLNPISQTNEAKNWHEVTMSLDTILPDLNDMNNYYRYIGSLTTPPCTENVVWNVFQSFVNISAHQLLSFRTNQIRANYREPQQIYDRKIRSSFVPPRGGSGKSASSDQSTTSGANANTISSTSILFGSCLAALILLCSRQ